MPRDQKSVSSVGHRWEVAYDRQSWLISANRWPIGKRIGEKFSSNIKKNVTCVRCLWAAQLLKWHFSNTILSSKFDRHLMPVVCFCPKWCQKADSLPSSAAITKKWINKQAFGTYHKPSVLFFKLIYWCQCVAVSGDFCEWRPLIKAYTVDKIHF